MKMGSAFVALLFMCHAGGVGAAPMAVSTLHTQSFLNQEAKTSPAQEANTMPVFMNKPKVGEIKTGSAKFGGPESEHAHHESQLQCGVTTQVGSDTDKWEDCPAECPYYAQNRKDTQHCTFLCVTGDQCGEWNGNKPIPDVVKGSKSCRGPMVQFCKEANIDGTDSCARCQSGFRLFEEDGQCYFEYWNTIIFSSAIVGVVVVVALVWFIDLCCRSTVNAEEVVKAQKFRSRSKILQPKNKDGHRHPYPIETNCCTTDVAGPGMLLHFNFQAFLIVWPLVIAIVWTILACFHNELFTLGTRKFGTPRSNCILVAWGYETQQRLMWTKVTFLVITYLFSFVTFLWFSVRQHRIYEEMDAKTKSMKDFALELKGLPELEGKDVEKRIAAAVNKATKLKVVGISVAWNYDGKEDTIMKALREDQEQRADVVEPPKPKEQVDPITNDPDPTAKMGPIHKWMYEQEKGVLGPDEEETGEDIPKLLSELKTTESAFVVFNTEEDKDDAMKIAEESGIDFEGNKLTFEELECEPKTVNWENFNDQSTSGMMRRFAYGVCCFYVPALAVWFFIFYVPYALSLYNFNYDNGAELPGYYGLIFTMVVVGGNATMYVVCDLVCDVIGFRFKDTKQVCYMLMYLFACMFNVLLDMVVTYYTAMKIMTGLDFRTYDGTRLSEIDTFTEQFETYAMQRSLAENTYRYAFPSTFLVPFLIEPFITVLIPYQIGKLIIRTHSEVKGACAEAYIAAFDFDLGRYADILLNVFLGILIFFFPGGYTWSLFYGMFISHIVIYLFDHWRVLQAIPNIKIVSKQVDWWAQVMLGGCAALIMSCLVFKANCESYTGYCIQGTKLILACTFAGTAHFVIHTLLLIYVVPTLGRVEKDETRVPEKDRVKFAAIAKEEANTWFSVNPVHCLRSKFIHKDKPYCRFSSVGKEHLLEINESIGCYFFDEPAETEDFDGAMSPANIKESATRLTKAMTGTK